MSMWNSSGEALLYAEGVDPKHFLFAATENDRTFESRRQNATATGS